MREPIELLGIYLHLARDAGQRMQLLQRDKLLVMCGVLGAQLELPSVASYCRAAILQHNPGHMVRRWPTFDDALGDPDFQHFLKQIQRRLSLETAERMLDELGIEMGDGERDAYYTDEEYAASVLGTTIEEMRDAVAANWRASGRGHNARGLPMDAMSRSQVRAVDQFAIEKLGLPGVCLMENAGRGVAECLLKRRARSVLIACGKGNNGGDGYVIARHLRNAGVDVQVLSAFADPPGGDAEVNRRVWIQSGHTVDIWRPGSAPPQVRPDWVVDAVLGTGARGPIRAPLDSLLLWLNSLDAKRLAVDLPSGMDCDTGDLDDAAFRPTLTCTLVRKKLGFAAAPPQSLGEISVIDIGVPNVAIEHGYQQPQMG